MKISYNWLKQYIDLKEDPHKLAEKLTQTGLEVEEVTYLNTRPRGIENIIVGEVLEVWQHPNADRLRVTKVNVGGAEPLQIVCGAPNVAVGQRVPVATVGVTVHTFKGESFEIKKSKIRGELSEGMICAEDEIGLSEDHDGILVLPEGTPVGSPMALHVEGYEDHIIEIGLTPNRVDAASHIGVARDLAALLGRKVRNPEAVLVLDQHKDAGFQVQIEDAEACPRYSGLIMRGIKVQPSPGWMQNYLKAIGLSPINNIVDATNFVLHEMGQPMHAFDLDKIKGNRIIVKRAEAGSKFITLDKQERTLDGSELMICNAEEPMALAGVFGGLESGITEATTDIFIESAYFNPSVVRKTARRHGLSTDASFRYERGADPAITLKALHRIAALIRESAGGVAVAPIFDEYPAPIAPVRIQLTYAYLNRIIGHDIPTADVQRILSNLEFTILENSPEGLLLEAPTYKTDVKRPIDVVEEVMRIYSLDRIPFGSQVKSVLQVDKLYEREKRRKRISAMLVDKGFFEAYTLTFVKEEENTLYNGEQGVHLVNPLSADLAQLRGNLLVPGLRSIAHNLNRRQEDVLLFKWGNTHARKGEQFTQQYHLAIWATGSHVPANWSGPARPADFYFLKGVVEQLLRMGGIHEWEIKEEETPYLSAGLSYYVGNKLLGRVGSVDSRILKKSGIDQPVYYADLDGDALLPLKNKPFDFATISRYPGMERDLALNIPTGLKYEQIRQAVIQAGAKHLKSVNLFDVYEGGQVKGGAKSYAIRLKFENTEQTLEDKTVDSGVQRILRKLQTDLGVSLRQ